MPIWLAAAILTALSLAFTGISLFVGNHALQIPLIQSLNHPGAFPDDPFAQTLPNYASLFWNGVAVLARLVPLEIIFILGIVLTRYLVIFAAGSVAGALSGENRLARVAVMSAMALAPRPLFGAGTIVETYFEHTGLAVAVLLLAVSSFLNGRRWTTAVLLAVGISCNIMYAAFAATYLLASFLVEPEQRRAWRSWLLPGAVCLVLSIPALFGAAQTAGTAVDNVALWLEAARVRTAHHLHPSTWGSVPFLKLLVEMGGVILVIALTRRSCRRPFRNGIAWSVAALFWTGLAFVAEVGLQSPGLMVAHPARGADFWYPLMIAALLSALVLGTRKHGTLGLLYPALLIGAALVWRSITGAFVVAAAVALLSVIVRGRMPYLRSARSMAVLLILIVAAVSGRSLAKRVLDENLAVLITYGPTVTETNREYASIAAWAETNTNEDARFLVDPRQGMFRALAMRPVFVTWKDGTAMLWDKPFATEWSRRISDLGVDISRLPPSGSPVTNRVLNEAYNSLSDAAVVKLARKYGVDYWVSDCGTTSSFPVAFRTDRLTVFDLSSPPPDSASDSGAISSPE